MKKRTSVAVVISFQLDRDLRGNVNQYHGSGVVKFDRLEGEYKVFTDRVYLNRSEKTENGDEYLIGVTFEKGIDIELISKMINVDLSLISVIEAHKNAIIENDKDNERIQKEKLEENWNKQPVHSLIKELGVSNWTLATTKEYYIDNMQSNFVDGAFSACYVASDKTKRIFRMRVCYIDNTQKWNLKGEHGVSLGMFSNIQKMNEKSMKIFKEYCERIERTISEKKELIKQVKKEESLIGFPIHIFKKEIRDYKGVYRKYEQKMFLIGKEERKEKNDDGKFETSIYGKAVVFNKSSDGYSIVNITGTLSENAMKQILNILSKDKAGKKMNLYSYGLF